MRKYNYILLITILVGLAGHVSYSQTPKNDLNLSLGYYNDNNHFQYLKANAKTKIDRKFQMVPGISLTFYLGSESPENLLGRAISDDKGDAVVFIPASIKAAWDKSAKHSFTVVSANTPLYDQTKATADVTRAKIKIDTGEDRKITATFLEWKDSAWVPVKGVDMKIAVRRLDADLNVNETATYTTDSLGNVSADFKRDSLPGDEKGNLILVAKTEDNETYGSVSSQKAVPWGTAFKYVSHFDKRTLFARRGRSPIWLELMAYGIIVAVWGVLFYLVMQIRKLKELGVSGA